MKDNRKENKNNEKGLNAYDNLCDATDNNLEIAEEMTNEVPLRANNNDKDIEQNPDELAEEEEY